MSFRKLLCLLFVFLSCLAAQAQSTSVPVDTARLKAQANAMADAFVKADFPTFVNYTYPRLVQLMGGKEKMIETVKKGIEDVKNDGFSFQSVQITLMPESVRAGKEIHSLVSQRIVMTAPGGSLATHSYLLAVSADGGHNWTFVDAAPLRDVKRLKKLFPEYNPALEIPADVPPVFTPSN